MTETADNVDTVLVCNSGSSSLKLACYSLAAGKKQKGFNIFSCSGPAAQLAAELKNYLQKHFSKKNEIVILHRIVHAGAVQEGAKLLDEPLRAKIRHWQVLAPLHNSIALTLLLEAEQFFPQVKQYALFDSGLYSDLPALARYYALPDTLSESWPIQRYGFHGLAHRAQWNLLQAQASNNRPYRKVITLQLGSGCSATAWKNGNVLDTSMGFSPLEGLSMATRSGSIDPGILLHLLRHEKFTIDSLTDLLNKESGISGLSGGETDIKKIFSDDSQQAVYAAEHFCYQILKMIGAYHVVLGGLDAISFGGGIGENNAGVREKILSALSFAGFSLDTQANKNAEALTALHKPNSVIHAWLTPVDEMQEMFAQYLHCHSCN